MLATLHKSLANACYLNCATYPCMHPFQLVKPNLWRLLLSLIYARVKSSIEMSMGEGEAGCSQNCS